MIGARPIQSDGRMRIPANQNLRISAGNRIINDREFAVPVCIIFDIGATQGFNQLEPSKLILTLNRLIC